MAPRRSAKIALGIVLAAFLFNPVAHFVEPAVTNQTEIVAQSNVQAEFWRVVSGQQVGRIGNTAQALANDLAREMGPITPEANALPAGIESFHARSNTAYGGITGEMGVNPFTNDRCTECGPLTDSFKAQLLIVKQGQVNVLIAQANQTAADAAWTFPFIAFGLPVWLALIILVLVCGGIIAADAAIQRRKAARKTRQLTKQYPRQMEQIAKANALLAIEPPPGVDVSEALANVTTIRDKLSAEIRRQSDPTVADDGARIERYQEQLREGLADLQQSIEIDEHVARELGLNQNGQQS